MMDRLLYNFTSLAHKSELRRTRVYAFSENLRNTKEAFERVKIKRDDFIVIYEVDQINYSNN